MLLDLKPLANRDFRSLFMGQMVSFFGTIMTSVAVPYQLYELTGSSFMVGMVGVAQLIPLLLTALIGGAYADALNRRKLLLWSEGLLALASLGLALNSLSASPSLWLIYVLAGISSALTGFHRPALDALTPRLLPREQLASIGPLLFLRYNAGAILGPALAGLLIAWSSSFIVYIVDLVSFLFSMIAIASIRNIEAPSDAPPATLRSVIEGLRYAKSRQELLGTYLVDFVAMIFGMPNALFPALAASLGGPSVLGWMTAAPAVGALVAALFSRWTKRVKRHGAAVAISASLWGVGIIGFGLATNLYLALFFLALAGAADAVSGIFRMTIWNETIPENLRGRLVGIEMVSYTSGPLLGHAESGIVAALAGNTFSVVSGGLACVVGVGICVVALPHFWRYHATDSAPKPQEEKRGPLEP